MKCLLCDSTAKLIGRFCGATSNSGSLFQFDLLQCQRCSHVQKNIDSDFLANVERCYADDYGHLGSRITHRDGKTVNRDIDLAKIISATLPLGCDGTLLDFGCGRGSLLNALGKELPKWRRFGFELTKQNQKLICASGASFVHGDLNSVHEQFELITLVHVLEHLTDPIPTLQKLSSLLSPNGQLVVIVPCFEKVHTDFFIYEHSSHFTTNTLNFLVTSIGLQVVDTLQDKLAPVEIGVVAKKPPNRLEQALGWSSTLPGRIRNYLRIETQHSDTRRIGIFGVGGAGLWLSQVLPSNFGFFVDDDPNKQGKLHAGKPIISVESIPSNSIVFVPFNSPSASKTMALRLGIRRPDIRFVDFTEPAP